MPDLDPLPPVARRPAFAPREGDFASLTARAARRRRARYATAGSGVAAAAGLALVMSLGAPGTDNLVADPVTTQDATASPDPVPSPEPTPTAEPSPSGSSGSAGGTVGTPAASPGEPSPEPADTPAPSPSATPAGSPVVHATLDRKEVAYATGYCETGSPGHGPGWCMRAPRDRTAQAGEPDDYVLEACRLPGSGSGTIQFNNELEIYFAITRDDAKVVYQWGNRTYEPGHHSLVVPAGRCARWTLTWDATDDAGDPLPPDRYGAGTTVDGTFGTAATQMVTYSFTLTVTE